MKQNYNRNILLFYILFFVLFAIFIRLIFLEAPLQSDDTIYFSKAESYSNVMLERANTQIPFRSGMLLPVSAIQNIFGYSIFAYYTYPIIIYSMLFFFLVFFSRMIESDNFVPYTVVITSTSALVLNQTSLLLPDMPCFVMALGAYLLFIQSNNKKTITVIFLLFISAFFGFLSYLIRMPNIVFLICIPLYELLKYKSLKRTLIFSSFFIIFWILEMTYFYIVTGDLFIRFYMMTKGVTLWSVYMPNISIYEYIVAPVEKIMKIHTGKILIICGLLGYLLAIYRKKWEIVALSTAGIFIFIIYSFSVNSFSPLVRALPLKHRYIVGFSIIMAICTAYLVYSINEFFKNKYSCFARNRYFSLGSILLILLVFIQIAELPSTVRGSVIYGNDSYFVADRLLRDKFDQLNIQKSVLANPVRDFRMYPNFSRLELRGLDYMKELNAGDIILYSISRLRLYMIYAQRRGDIDRVEMLQPYLGHNPSWDYLLEAGDIVMAQVSDRMVESKKFANFTAYNDNSSVWAAQLPEISIEKNANSTIDFKLPAHTEHFYVYSFPGSWSLPPENELAELPSFANLDSVQVNLQYRLSKDIKSLVFFIHQYDAKKRIKSDSFNIPVNKGIHAFKQYIPVNGDTISYRLYFRFITINEKTTFTLKKLNLSALEMQ